MRDPERIIQGRTNDDAVLLMRAARRDAPSAQSRLRTLAVLGLPTTLSVVGKAATAAALFTGTKGLLTGAIVGVALGSTLATIAVNGSQSSSGVQAVQPMRAQQARAVASTWAHDQKMATPALPSASDVLAVAATAATARATNLRLQRVRAQERSAQAMPETTHQASLLAREVAALDRVRAAALAQQYGRVLTLLDAYQRDFPQGALQPEAQVLRVEALARSGQLSRARALAETLLATNPSGPLSHRIRMAAPSSEAFAPSDTNSGSDSNPRGIAHWALVP